MPFEAPITIREAVQKVLDNKYVLPSIQREFIWSTEQIAVLFDSLLRGYPVGSFLFWYVAEEQVATWQFYKFLSLYHERDSRHNAPAVIVDGRDVTAVLDGQQRLTSLVIGLAGSYAYKLPNKRRSNNAAYPRRTLHIDLMRPADESDGEKRYALRFLTEEEVASDNTRWWIPMPEVFKKVRKLENVLAFMADQRVAAAPQAARAFAAETLARLCECLNTEKSINYFLEKDADLDKVLQIFIRTNSGGTKLSYSDLLLSIATASWTHLDARQEIHGLVDELCSYGDELTVDKDFVLKACLVLADIGDIKFKVTNFTRENTARIEQRWWSIRKALALTLQLSQSFGLTDRSLLSTNALIPIAYYLQRLGATESFLSEPAYRAERSVIRRWLVTVLMRGTFGSMADTILAAIRGVLAASPPDQFPAAAINLRLTELNRSTRFVDEEIEVLLDMEYGDRRVFLLLSLLYPTFDYATPFHIDHVYPRAKMTERRLIARELPTEVAREAAGLRDNVANLQLLKGPPNQSKSDSDFDAWLTAQFPSDTERGYFLAMHLFPPMPAFTYESFLEFLLARRAIFFRALRVELNPEG